MSLPTVHRILDREGVPRSGRGIPRLVPARICERIVRTHSALRSDSEVLVLAAVQSRLHGVASAREVARLAHISPTKAGKTLRRLVDARLVVRRTIRTMWAGAVVPRERYQIDITHPDWSALRPVVDRIEVAAPPIPRSNAVPKQYWHLFWNADPKALRVDEHGVYIARRMLGADSLDPALWALANVPPEQIMKAIEGRGADPRTRAFVINHLRAARHAEGPTAGSSTGETGA